MKIRHMQGKLALLLTIASVVTLSACGNGNNEANKENAAASPTTNDTAATTTNGTDAVDTSKHVDLDWYYPGTQQKDVQAIEDAMNKIVNEKINASIHLHTIDWGSYDQKMNVMISTGEKFDIAFTSSWTNDYLQGVSKGAYAPLDDLLPKYAPQLLASMKPGIWDATRKDGKIYAVPNQQIFAKSFGMFVRKDLADKYKDSLPASAKGMPDFEAFFAQIVKNEKGVTPLAGGNAATGLSGYEYYEPIGANDSPGQFVQGDASLTVVNQYERPDQKQAYETAKKWAGMGFFSKDIANEQTDVYEEKMKSGKYAAVAQVMKPGGEVEFKNKFGFDFVQVPYQTPYISTDGILSTLNAISKTSANPERAMMFLELINTDKDLYNLICHGIEGKHYVFADKDKGVIGMPDGVTAETNGYNPSSDWMFGNQFNSYYVDATQVGTWEATKALNDSAVVSPAVGFAFNPDPVSAQIAQTKKVIDQYRVALGFGSVDPDKYYAEFLKKLKDAGSDAIIAEKQKQVDAWKAANGK